ncbi:DinB family protein [Sporosarcina sp. ANT_H38]|uniref:DinB family protein n=1 Tax=unclassified Sporosarcina TaxID=2647733 RepID=UPI0011F1F18F|nr:MULTISPECIES: DinB family protein [unclassified Sporosarcina]KAA0940631.1 DinB family protein [Sporosarcina sp. ANT_H38]QJS06567.1 putative enzyme [Sporosarcina sp.]
MDSKQLIILNLEEVRRRSLKIWMGIPINLLDWKPDKDAMSFKQVIRHVLESEYDYHQILLENDLKNDSPYNLKPFLSIEEEIEFSGKYRKDFFNTINSYSIDDFINIKIDRTDVGYVRTLGDMLLRIAYHESIHSGQTLQSLRTVGVERPDIWD